MCLTRNCGGKMKATFKTSDAVYTHKIGWFTSEEYPYCKLTVHIEFAPEELKAIKRLGIDKNNLIDSDNLLYRKRMSNRDFKYQNADWFPQEILVNRYEKETHQNIVENFFKDPRELSYRNLGRAQRAIQQIKDQLVIIKGNIEAPDPDTTFEI